MTNHLPPQAYTKETLSKAYTWVQTQPVAIQKMAANPDTLVALYCKYTKHPNSMDLALDSTDKFKDSLKALLKDKVPPSAPIESSSAPKQTDFKLDNDSSLSIQPVSNSTKSIPSTYAVQVTPKQEPLNFENKSEKSPSLSSTTKDTASTENIKLDPKQLGKSIYNLIEETKNELHMESDMEVLRLLLTVGHKKLKSTLFEK